uniref:Ribonuclease H-like domain-containing protein n=1 Tax=Tanacetum cinerariifolium TaxID=118510 RepID=A0A699GPZ3_TANCI|nr:ribonuclease H-like domain-containing protein [Tanacetum cinerariifolium]
MDLDLAHMMAASMVPMLKPENGHSLSKTQVVAGVKTLMPITSVEDKAQRRLEVKARSTLIMDIPDEHQIKFNSIMDATLLMEAIEKRFGGNAATKKTQRNLLKQQYENFIASNSEMLDQTIDRLQKLVYEPEVKGMSSSNSSIKNMAFMSPSNNNNTNGAVNTAQAVNTTHGFSNFGTQVNTANIDNLSDSIICTFLASQPSGPLLANEDLEQIHSDDFEEMDLIWQMAMLTIRARRGHFAREWRDPRSQDTKYKESTRKTVPVETPASTTLVSCDGLSGYDWSDQAEEGLNYALMAYTSTSLESKNSCIEKFWTAAKVKSINREAHIHVKVDVKKVIIFEASIRRDLQFVNEGGVDCLPNDTIFEKLALMRKPIRKVTEVPRPSDLIEHVADEAVYKELDDRLLKGTITASSLKAKQDNGNINKTESKKTPNELSSQGTNLGGGPRGNTLQNDEDRMKLNELIDLCITLQSRVLDLEKTKTTQALAIDSLKRMVKKLEKKKRSRTYKLKRLYKAGLSAMVESFDVNDQDDEQMFDVNDLQSKEVFVQDDVADKEVTDKVQKVVKEEVEDINTTKLIIDAAHVNTAGEINDASIPTTDTITATMTVDEVTLAQALMEIKSTKSKAKGIVLQEPSESRTTISSKKSQDKGKAIMIEEHVKINADYQLAERLQADEQQELNDAEKATLFMVNTFVDYITELVKRSSKKAKEKVMEGSLKRGGTKLKQESSKRARIELEQENSTKQKIDNDKETAKLKPGGLLGLKVILILLKLLLFMLEVNTADWS